jgi:hypothetical protein
MHIRILNIVIECSYTDRLHAECRNACGIMLRAVMPSATMLKVIVGNFKYELSYPVFQ